MGEKKISDIKTEEELLLIAASGYNNSMSETLIKRLKVQNKEALTPKELAKYIRRISNFSGPKTISGRIKALNNLIVKESSANEVKESEKDPQLGGIFSICTNDEDRKFVNNRYKEYVKNYEINTSADQAILTQIIVEELNIEKLRTIQQKYFVAITKHPTQSKFKDPSMKIDSSIKRLKSLIETLGADRKLRTGGKDNGNEDNIASLALKYEKMGALDDDTIEEAIIDRDKIIEKEVEESSRKQDKALRELGL